MREELRHSTSIGNFEGIDSFLSVVFDQGASSQEAIKNLCSFIPLSRLNYSAAMLMLCEYDIIQASPNGDIIFSEKGETIRILSPNQRIQMIGQIAFEYLINERLLDCTKAKYSLTNRAIELPNNSFSFSAAVFRNFLITISALKIINGRMVVSRAYEAFFENKSSNAKRKITQEELLKKLEEQQLDGDAAELYVVKYENKRLNQQGKEARRISQIDAGAGFDILSYSDASSIEYDMYIEVKAYHGHPHFYWSSNERNTSKGLGKQYYLYLVDIDKIDEESYKPMIIRDPFNSLTANSWLIEPHSYYVYQI